MSEVRSANGNIIANACGNNLSKPLYTNRKIEVELISFKREIEEKFNRSHTNQDYRFPRIKEVQIPTRNILSSSPLSNFVIAKTFDY